MKQEILRRWYKKIWETEDLGRNSFNENGLRDPIGLLFDLFIEDNPDKYEWADSLPKDKESGLEFGTYFPAFRMWAFEPLYVPEEVSTFFEELIVLTDKRFVNKEEILCRIIFQAPLSRRI